MSLSNRHFYAFLSFFLSFCLVFNCLAPNIAEAAPITSNKAMASQTIKADIGEIPNKLPKEKLELTSKRTKYSTRYLNPDGSFTEEIFLEPQFYMDKADKKWKKIDNTLKASTKKAGTFESTANDFKAYFSNETANREIMSLEKEDKSLALVPVNAKSTKGIISTNEIKYEEIYDKTDIRYYAKNNKVKEDIILKQYANKNVFTFELKLKGLKASVDKDNTIFFTDSKGNKIWFFETPYMTDAEGKYSDKVNNVLREENGKTYVDVIADEAFLTNAETKYPVTIDPTITATDIIRDTFISAAQPTSSYSANSEMYTGYTTTYGATRSLVQFYLPSLPSAAVIQSAAFNAYQTKADAVNADVGLYRITSSWTGYATWNTQPTTRTTAESNVISTTSNAYWQWYITALVKDWYNGIQPNYGFMLKQQNEETATYRAFNTVNGTINKPTVTINYIVDPVGLEDFWSYTPEGVNPANGNLVFQGTDVSIPGRGISVDITRTYNSKRSHVVGKFGYGWTSNMEAKLTDSGSGPIMFLDGDFTYHIFGQKPDGKYEAHGGVYLTLIKNADGTYTMTQMDGTNIHFNQTGKLSKVVDTNGNTTSYTYNQSGNISAITDASGRTTTISFGTDGYISSITDSASRTTLYDYDTVGNLAKITDAASGVTTFGYDADHNLTSITNTRNIKTTIEYDASDRVVNIKKPITIDGVSTVSTTNYAYDTVNTAATVTDGEGKKVQYTYNPNGNVVQVTENPLDAQNKAVTTFAYDNNNNLVEVKDANTNKANTASAYIYTYDSSGNITAVKLPENQTSTFAYDGNNNRINEKDFNGSESSYGYDGQNNNIESTDPNIQTVASRYDAYGNVLSSSNPMSAADNIVPNSSFEMDANADNWPDSWTKYTEPGTTASFGWSATPRYGNKAISISNPTGWALVGANKIKHIPGQKYILSGYIKTVNTANTALLKVEFFDTADNWIDQQVVYGLKGTNDWSRIQAVVENVPANTDKIRATVGLNAGTGTAYFDGIQLEKGTILSAYNLVDNSSFERDTNSDGIPDNWEKSPELSLNDKLDANADTTYVGQKSFKITGESGKNKYIKQRIYISGDQNSRFTLSGWSKQSGANVDGGSYLVQVGINNTDGTVYWANDLNFSKTSSSWQHIAKTVAPTKPFTSIDVVVCYYNQTGTAWFDALRLEAGTSITGRAYEAGANYVKSIKTPMGNTVFFAHDAAGNKTTFTDAKGKDTYFAYNAKNLLTRVTDAKQGVTNYEYDGQGNRTKVTDAKGNTTGYEYNEFDKVSRIVNPLNQTIQFGYDKNGNTTKLIFPKGNTVSYTYDAMNRADGIYYNGTKKWGFAYDANGNLVSASDSANKTTNYVYDKNNRILQAAKGTAGKLDYTYDGNGNPISLTASAGSNTTTAGFGYNTLNQLTSLSRDDKKIANFVYDERGNITSSARNNSTYIAYEYDADNRLTSVKNYGVNYQLIDSYNYSYDANGNRTSVATNTGTTSYNYDELNQLTQETLPDGTMTSYEHDAAGNRTKKTVTKGTTSTTTNYVYDAANQLISVNGQAYTYDANGNLLSNGTKTYVYDEENRLIQVKNSLGTVIAVFTYDHEGKRISMTTGGVTTYYHYDGDKVAYETDGNNNITISYTYDPAGNPVTMTKNGVTYYYHINGHGDVVALTDASGGIAAQYQYDAYGNTISQSGTMALENPYRYAGYRYDRDIGLYYLMARYYDAGVGRFLSRDTFYGFEKDVKSLNLYGYCGNNPVMHTDPSGHSWNFKQPWNSVNNVGFAIDVAAYAIGAIVGLVGAVGTVREILKRNARGLVVQATSKLLQKAGLSAAGWVASTIVGGLNLFLDFSIGKAIARVWDRYDTNRYNGLCNKFW